jgi:hypothetical protein
MNLTTTFKQHFLYMLVIGKHWVQFLLVAFLLVSDPDLCVVKLILTFTKLNI